MMQTTRWPRLLPATLLFSGLALGQAAPWIDDASTQDSLPAQMISQGEANAAKPETMAPPVVTATNPSAVVIPAGTRVMMVLKSPLHTTSGTAGSGIYLETLYPVVQDNRIIIPAHTQVQGVVEGNRRPGHFERTSEFRFRFTTLIFSNNYVAPIQGVLQSIPGARNIRTKDKAGTLNTVDQPEKVIVPGVAGAVGGAIIGSYHHFGIGLFTGAGLGAALGLGSVLLKRGDEISLASGTGVEMILQAALNLEQAQVDANARFVTPPSAFPVIKNPGDDDGDKRRKSYQREDRPLGLPGLLLLAH
ncbi:MAG TPA: hypothetical protein VKH81_24935 [Candidatus Angelobacter sp.]|nr:hypothetical protein [Candidatus Angelobacter sp.]